MKKTRRVGNKTDTNFFTSEFKLTSTEFLKPHRQNKMHSTFCQLKQGLFREESKKSKRFTSVANRPVIQQLKFFTNQKEDDFKLPQSASKRAVHKNFESPKKKQQQIMMQLMEEFYQETKLPPQKQSSVGYLQRAMAQRKFKQLSVRRLKDQLEKSAMQKFKGTFAKENNQNQNNITQQNAEALYLLLKNAKIKTSQDVKRFRQHTEEQQQDQHPHSQTLQYKNQTMRQTSDNNKGAQKNTFQYNIDDPLPSFRKETKNTFEQQKEIEQQVKAQVILDINSRQKFSSASDENSGFDDDFDLPHQSTIVKKQSSNINPPASLNNLGNGPKISEGSAQQPEKSKKQIQPPLLKEQKKGKNQQNQYRQNKALQNNSRKSAKQVQSEKSKEKPPKMDNKANPQNKREESSVVYDNIPSIKTVESTEKISKHKNSNTTEHNSNGDHHFLNDNGIEKVLTTKTLESKHQNNVNNKVREGLMPPPKLKNIPNTPKQSKNKVSYQSEEVDQDQLEELDIGYAKKQQQQKKLQEKQQQKGAIKLKHESNHHKETTIPEIKENKKQPVSGSPEEQEESEADAQDQLQFYIQKIQDVGQYRINSKDIYNDKSISKEINQAYKMCSYYMAHQFLFLTKKTYQLLNSDSITKQFYGLTVQDLNQLKSEGHLEEWVSNLFANLQESKRLLKKCYDDCKPLLRKQEQILLLDGKTNYHMKCCSSLIQQFSLIYRLFEKKPEIVTIQKRCCYLIELFVVLKLLHGEEIKESLDLEEIQDYKQHIKAYKYLLIGQ